MPRGSAKKQRKYAQAQARKLAASQTMPGSCDVLIVGAGASGLLCALEASSSATEKDILLMEAKPTLGAPILATGNGRCNFCHEPLEPAAYNHPLWMEEFFSAVCTQWPKATPSRVVQEYFSTLGLLTTSHEGRLYPRSLVAASIRNLLLEQLDTSSVKVATLRKVVAVEPSDEGFRVHYQEQFREDPSTPGGWTERCLLTRRLVLACGGASLDLIQGLKLPLVPCEPVLCPVEVETELFRSLDGHRAKARVRAYSPSSEPLFDECGEILFRSSDSPQNGVLSGIVAYNLSRKVDPGDSVVLDLLPECTHEQVASLLMRDGVYDPRHLDGALDPAIAHVLLPHALDAQSIGDASKALSFAVEAVKSVTCTVVGKAFTQSAQVRRGGLDLRAVTLPSLEVDTYPGLYVLGEALDIDGACGGYNLGFAWLSGLLCGQSLAHRHSSSGR